MENVENRKKNSALIAMSGGVDSSVAAYLMTEKGFECQGTTMRLYRNEDIGQCGFHTCCSQRDIDDASEVAFQLDMPYEVLDFTMDFRKQIIEKFIRIYEEGGTPNPCIDCNRYMKFDKLLSFAQEKKMDFVVTGHYARVVFDRESGRYFLKKALDETKDQSYALFAMTQNQLAHTLFPLGDLHKKGVRELAEKLHFVNARKHDSQDICFVPHGDYTKFMEEFRGRAYPAGDFLDEKGNIVGRHNGAVRYTLGQRKGLGLAMGEPVYVFDKSMERNTVTVGPESMLYSNSLIAGEMNWIAIPNLERPMKLMGKTRYGQKEQSATVIPLDDGTVRVEFDAKQRANTPGQAVVFYDKDVVVGGGTILKVIRGVY
ncbi:tRNA 2-thiouridine(34) synthase MnmA [Anaerotignum sp.]|uniref:tRNA 2-thiouridine(34) synthase MnmA n=1 Tax=Anaerotignum sp. TaxID=2039241 RepID=UPI0028B15126|nr:tRNA 2-thiouridine(34) synthase MnmA [Anaerotignum sp.]